MSRHRKHKRKGNYFSLAPNQQTKPTPKTEPEIKDRPTMKFNKKDGIITGEEKVEGLFSCKYEYKIKDQDARLTWLAPKFDPEMWHQVLSFFRWTYETTKSESQVRLFVNVKEGEWAAWAFPQKARTGMSAEELPGTQFDEQRQQFNSDWIYFGTIHHHCSMSAFQSGTDTENEQGQDGIHITIGHVDKPVMDIHMRFYRKGLKYTPSATWIWDADNPVDRCPKEFQQYLPKDIAEKSALLEMCTFVETPFPEQWKANLIDTRPPAINAPVIYTGAHGHEIRQHGPVTVGQLLPKVYSSESDPKWKRARNAWNDMVREMKIGQYTPDEMKDAITDLQLGAHEVVLKACVEHRVNIDDIRNEVSQDMEKEMEEEIKVHTMGPQGMNLAEHEAWEQQMLGRGGD